MRLADEYNISIQIDSSYLNHEKRVGEMEYICVDEKTCGIYHMTSGSTGIPILCVRNFP